MIEIYAHRGANREAPENTLLAFQKALEIGVDGIELDVLLTKDKVPIVRHNKDIAGRLIHKMTLAEISAIDLGAGQKIPTLVQALELLAAYPCQVILDLKKQPGMVRTACELIGGIAAELIPLHRLSVSSFHPTYLTAFQRYHPKVPLAWIVSRRSFTLVPMALSGKFLKVCALHPGLWLLTPGLVARARALGWKIRSWVANRPEDFAKAMALKIDGVFTDDPRLARNILQGGN